jgi:medium-chain acyl-[acyl-carrier-protein] hydrolase
MRSPWFPFGTQPDAPVRLLTLPHAGAGASVFRTWGRGLPEPIGVIPVQPPGRERRYGDPPFTRVGPLVRELATMITDEVAPPYAILGHSTGALCAFEVTRELSRRGNPQPVHLFVCGRPAPQFPRERSDLARLSVPELAGFLRELEGTPEAILNDLGLLARMQPTLAADFDVNECYTFTAGDDTPLDVPITAFAGRTDPVAVTEPMAAWAQHTSASFRIHVLEGGHFAIFEHAPAVHAAIAERLREPAGAGKPGGEETS